MRINIPITLHLGLDARIATDARNHTSRPTSPVADLEVVEVARRPHVSAIHQPAFPRDPNRPTNQPMTKPPIRLCIGPFPQSATIHLTRRPTKRDKQGSSVAPFHPRDIFIQALNFVELANFIQENVNNYVSVIQENPLLFAMSFRTAR